MMEYYKMSFQYYSTISYTIAITYITIFIGLYLLSGFYKLKSVFWKDIGALEEICMYDFYNGEPRNHSSVNTASDLEPSLVSDRRFLIYTPRSESQPRNEIVLDKKEFISLKSHIVFKNEYTNAWMDSIRDTVYFPDGSYIYMYDCGDDIARYFRNAYGAGLINYRVGVQTNYDKTLSRDFYRYSKTSEDIRTILNPRHAMCTLVNTQSVDFIRTKLSNKGEREKLSPHNFRPHLIVNIPKFHEDKIQVLEIGTAVFGDPLPCIIDHGVNYNPLSKQMSTNNDIYTALSNNRQLKTKFPDISTTSYTPVFGINFTILKHGEFRVTDRVYAKF